MDRLHEFREALGRRIDQVVAKFSTKAAAAAAAGVTLEQLNKWIAGQVKVPVEALYRLAESAPADFAWLATGDAARIDEPTLRLVLTAIAAAQAEHDTRFDPAKFASAVLVIHDYARREEILNLDSMREIIDLSIR